MSKRRIAVVIGSTRPARICGGIATWTRDRLQEGSALDYELLDLAEVDLPLLDEPMMAALGDYRHEHTRAWSRTVSSYDGFMVVFPQYNWGYPAVVKNALDFLYAEWHGKPASLLTYGSRGGNRAADQLLHVFEALDMTLLDEHVEARVTRDDLDADWQLVDVDATLRPCAERLRRIDDQFTAALAG